MILQFVLLDAQIHPPPPWSIYLDFLLAVTCRVKTYGKDFTECFNSSFNLLNLGYALGEFTSGGHTNTSHLSGLMLTVSVHKQISKPQI